MDGTPLIDNISISKCLDHFKYKKISSIKLAKYLKFSENEHDVLKMLRKPIQYNKWFRLPREFIKKMVL